MCIKAEIKLHDLRVWAECAFFAILCSFERNCFFTSLRVNLFKWKIEDRNCMSSHSSDVGKVILLEPTLLKFMRVWKYTFIYRSSALRTIQHVCSQILVIHENEGKISIIEVQSTDIFSIDF